MAYLAIFLLTVADLTLTVFGLKLGVIEEANPIVNALFSFSPLAAVISVLIFTGLAIYIMYRFRSRVRWLPAAANGLICIKLWIIAMHFGWIIQIL